MEIKIDKEFKDLIPKINYEEFLMLEESIKKEGCRDPIITWNNLILDGHNRYKICKAHEIKFKTKEIQLESRKDAILWIIENQLGRRNICKYDRIMLELKKKCILQDTSVTKMSREMRKEIAKRTNTSEGTIIKVKKIYETLKPIQREEATKKIRSNEETINSTYNKIIKQEKETELEKIRKEKLNQIPIKSKIEIIEGDLFKEIPKIKREYNLIFCDPPYNIIGEEWDKFKDLDRFKEFTINWIDLTLEKLAKDGRFYVIFSQKFMFDFYEWMKPLCEKYDLIFGNMLIWNYKNNIKHADNKRYKYTYEPVFYYRKKDAPELNLEKGEEWGPELNNYDVCTYAMPQTNFKEDKKLHPTQKPIKLLKKIILTGSNRNDWILDGFAGSGTTGLAAKECERNVTLIEKDPNYIKIIKERLK